MSAESVHASPGLLERDDGGGAEAHLADPAADRVAEYPRWEPPAVADPEIEPAAVAALPRRCEGCASPRDGGSRTLRGIAYIEPERGLPNGSRL